MCRDIHIQYTFTFIFLEPMVSIFRGSPSNLRGRLLKEFGFFGSKRHWKVKGTSEVCSFYDHLFPFFTIATFVCDRWRSFRKM